MGPRAINEVAARITEIEQRFATPRAGDFRASLQAASATSAPATSRVARPASTGTTASASAATATLSPSSSASPTTTPLSPSSTAAGPVGGWARRLPPAGRAWAGDIERAATRAGVDPALLAALVWTESGFRPDAVSHAGARGLAQLMPATAAGLGVDPDDPQQNLEGGARFLRSMLDRFGSPDLALAAYNAGPGRVERAGGIPNIPETRAYVPKVLAHYDQIRGAT